MPPCRHSSSGRTPSYHPYETTLSRNDPHDTHNHRPTSRPVSPSSPEEYVLENKINCHDSEDDLRDYIEDYFDCSEQHPIQLLAIDDISRIDIYDPPDHILAAYDVPLYTPLSLDGDEIRLLRLYASEKWDDEIEISLFTVSLRDRPKYQALSYVWGDTKTTYPITVNGDHQLRVTENLLHALQQLRRRKSSRYLWIDAICINQSNIEERSQQVGLMSEIYKNPSSVIAWLGPGGEIGYRREPDTLTHSSTIAKFHYDADGDCLEDEWFRPKDTDIVTVVRGYLTVDIDWRIPNASLPLSTSFRCVRVLANLWARFTNAPRSWSFYSNLEHLDELLAPISRAKWWKRLWTVQESILPDHLYLMCGPYTISWSVAVTARLMLIERFPVMDGSNNISSFCETIAAIERYRVSCGRKAATSVYELSPDREPAMAIRDDPRPPLERLLRLFHDFQPRHATDPRDKIFGLLGVLPSEIAHSIMDPDYRLTTSQTYQYTARSMINLTRDLSFLPDCSKTAIWSSAAGDPTWVPNWADNNASGKRWVVLQMKLVGKEGDICSPLPCARSSHLVYSYDGLLNLYKDAVLELEGCRTAIITHVGYCNEPQDWGEHAPEVNELEADDWEVPHLGKYGKVRWYEEGVYDDLEWYELLQLDDEFEPDKWEPDGTQPSEVNLDDYDTKPGHEHDTLQIKNTSKPFQTSKYFTGTIGSITGRIYSPVTIKEGDELFFFKTRSNPAIIRPQANLRPPKNIRLQSQWPESYNEVVLEPSLRPTGPGYYAWLGDFDPQRGSFDALWAEKGAEQVIFLQ